MGKQPVPGHQTRLGEPWVSFSRRDKIYSLLAIIVIFILITVVFSDLVDWDKITGADSGVESSLAGWDSRL